MWPLSIQWLAFIGVILLSIIVPAGIFLGRSNIRARRYEVVKDLEALFAFAKKTGDVPLIIPSFELVKYKYRPSSGENREDAKGQGTLVYVIPVAIYAVLTAVGFFVTFGNLEWIGQIPMNYFPLGHPQCYARPESVSVLVVIGYTFIGGYIWTVQYLVKRVSNFDLSPLSFLRSAIHILFGIFVISAVYGSGMLGNLEAHYTTLVAFVLGFYPTLFLNAAIARFSSIKLKRVTDHSRALQEELPLDTILGIDPWIKFRLSEFEIEDVQNLATINPIQIFVETAYGLYEVIDWVAQAQLILAVGPQKTGRLRNMAIRTIFDLERALDNPQLKCAIENILLPTAERCAPVVSGNGRASGGHVQSDSGAIPGSSEVPLDSTDLGEALVSIIRDDLHVKRLRQIWDVIASRVDERPAVILSQ
jgi:hypothetical protein